MPTPTLHPELRGPRFDDHQVPIEVLKDFAAFEEMLIEVAKREYLAAHPGRARIPRGFTKGLELRLASIEPGSAKLSLVLVGLSLLGESTYFTRAQEKIVNTIGKIDRGEQPELAPELLRYFDRFGRSLLHGESINWQRPEGQETRLTPEVRVKLLRASQADEWTDEVMLKGRVSAIDVANGRFDLELRGGTRLRAPLEEQFNATVFEALKGYKSKRMIAVKAILLKDKTGNPKRVEIVEHVTLLDPLDVETRLDDLAELKDHWLNGRGSAPDKDGLVALAEAFEDHFESELPLPYLYPTPEGGVLAEWTFGEWSVSLDIALPKQAAEYQAFNLRTDESTDLDLDLSSDAGWATLNALLKDLGSLITA